MDHLAYFMQLVCMMALGKSMADALNHREVAISQGAWNHAASWDFLATLDSKHRACYMLAYRKERIVTCSYFDKSRPYVCS